MGERLLTREVYFAGLVVEADHLCLNFGAELREVFCGRHVKVIELGDVDRAVHVVPQVDKDCMFDASADCARDTCSGPETVLVCLERVRLELLD
ncbi:hypothetical protein D9M72_511870 [compost metagenome]